MAKDYTAQRELDNRVCAIARELEAHGIKTEFVCKADGTCKSELTVTSVNGKNIKKRVKIIKNSQGDYRWYNRIDNVEKFGIDNNHIYILVDEFEGLHIVPSKVYRSVIEMGHYEWLISYGKKGKPHNENTAREFLDFHNDFLNCFEYFFI